MSALVLAARAPEPVTLSPRQHDLVLYAVVVAGFALFAHFLYNWNSKDEVSSRYRPAVLASLCIAAIATVSYFVIFVFVRSGYVYDGGSYSPTPDSLTTLSPRYMDWSVTVPLLTVELLAVCTLAGRKLSALRASTIVASFVMIATGYLGAQAFASGSSQFWLWLWWGVSMVFFAYLYVALVPVALKSARELGGETGEALTLATGVLFTTFLVYPVVYLVPVFFHGGWWTTSMQVAYSAADVVAKVAFGMLVHKVAKLRTASDVAAGEDTHPEPIWVNDVHRSDGVQPVQRAVHDGVAHELAPARSAEPARVNVRGSR